MKTTKNPEISIKIVWKIKHLKLHIRKQDFRKILWCSWYIKYVDTMENQRLKQNIKKQGARKTYETKENIKKRGTRRI